jgi:hypothetical protein
LEVGATIVEERGFDGPFIMEMLLSVFTLFPHHYDISLVPVIKMA